MYHPTTRLLTILELLQTHPSLTGAQLARRLEVEPRSVRRYIQMLQDMGMPVEATHGPGGGYRLRPGFKLPPLMFSEDEATAIVLGLLGTSWLELGLSAVAVEGALAKVTRVLPVRARERLNAVAAHMILSPHNQEARPDAALLINLSDVIQQRRRIMLDYRSYHDQVTHRMVEPYGIAGWWGRWYLAGYCCLRQEYRLFSTRSDGRCAATGGNVRSRQNVRLRGVCGRAACKYTYRMADRDQVSSDFLRRPAENSRFVWNIRNNARGGSVPM